MANLSGTASLVGKPKTPTDPSPAVNEWSTRVGSSMPHGDFTRPRNTLRGHPTPWKNRSVDDTLNDPGPLHASVNRTGLGTTGVMSGHYAAAGNEPGMINTTIPKTTSTAALEKGDWEQRVNMNQAPLRGSIAPNWKPLTEGQHDLTTTGSCNRGSWDPHNHTSSIAPFIEDAERQAQAKKKTNSTAAIGRGDWEERLKDYGYGSNLEGF